MSFENVETQDDVDEVEALRHEVDELRSVVKDQQETIDELRILVEHKHERGINRLREHLYGDQDGIKHEKDEKRIEEESVVEILLGIEDRATTDENLRDEQVARSQGDAQLRRLIEGLADETGVELHNLDIEGEDKITQLLKYGPEAIVDGRPKQVHHRARCILSYIGDYGDGFDDSNGRGFFLTRSQARDCLRDKRDESLTSTQVGRIFEKITELSGDSTRRATVGKTPSGEGRLKIAIDGGESR